MAISGTYAAGDAKSYKDCFVEVDLLGTDVTWAAIDSWATQVDVSGEEVPTGSVKPFSGNPIVFAGDKDPVKIVLTIVYTQGTDDAFYQIRSRFESAPGGDFNIRFAPAGSAASNLIFETTGGKLTGCPIPGGGGDAVTATVCTVTLDADAITMGVM